jgi:hypothetical protein
MLRSRLPFCRQLEQTTHIAWQIVHNAVDSFLP